MQGYSERSDDHLNPDKWVGKRVQYNGTNRVGRVATATRLGDKVALAVDWFDFTNTITTNEFVTLVKEQ